MKTISGTQMAIHVWARKCGWYDGAAPSDPGLVPSKLLLIVTELAEAFEELRTGHLTNEIYFSESKETPDLMKPEGFPIELADAVIRIFDLAQFLNIDLETYIDMKMEYNSARPHRHGGKTV